MRDEIDEKTALRKNVPEESFVTKIEVPAYTPFTITWANDPDENGASKITEIGPCRILVVRD